MKSVEASRRRSPTHWFKTRESLVSLLACLRLQRKKDFRQRADPVAVGAVSARHCRLRSSRCPLCFSFQVIYSSFGGSTKGLHFNNLIVGLVLLTRGRDEEKAKCKLLMHVFVNSLMPRLLYRPKVGKLFDLWGHGGFSNLTEGPDQEQMDGVFW